MFLPYTAWLCFYVGNSLSGLLLALTPAKVAGCVQHEAWVTLRPAGKCLFMRRATQRHQRASGLFEIEVNGGPGLFCGLKKVS